MAARHATITRWLLKRRRYNALQAVQNVQAQVQTVKERHSAQRFSRLANRLDASRFDKL